MNLAELKDGVSAKEQLLEVLGDNNKEEENTEEVKATLHWWNVVSHEIGQTTKTMPTTPGSISPSPATTTSAKLWRSWRRQKTATWSNSEQRRRTAVHRARGNSNTWTTSWTTSSGTTRPALIASSTE